MKKQRKMMEPKKKYLGTLEEVIEILVRWNYFGEKLTLDDCSKVMGLSRSAIKAIQGRALANAKSELLRRDGKNAKLSDYVNLTKHRSGAAKCYGATDDAD